MIGRCWILVWTNTLQCLHYRLVSTKQMGFLDGVAGARRVNYCSQCVKGQVYMTVISTKIIELMSTCEVSIIKAMFLLHTYPVILLSAWFVYVKIQMFSVILKAQEKALAAGQLRDGAEWRSDLLHVIQKHNDLSWLLQDWRRIYDSDDGSLDKTRDK